MGKLRQELAWPEEGKRLAPGTAAQLSESSSTHRPQGWLDALVSSWQHKLRCVFGICNFFFQTLSSLLLLCKVLDIIHPPATLPKKTPNISQCMLIIIVAKLSIFGNQSNKMLPWKACTPLVTSLAVKKVPLK